MDEFHSVFVSNRGKVWSCGHGQGGRLGTGSDKPALTPVPVSLPNHYICVKAEVAVNHTLLLLSTGKVLSFGLNTHHQLGIIPYIKFTCRPEMIYMEPFDGIIKGMCAAKYHSVFYTTNAVYTCGTNAGQLGHKEIHNTSFITVPKKVTYYSRTFFFSYFFFSRGNSVDKILKV
ncbi:hypothetical protein AAG570_003684 [Ranatra chinensis]|uniref:Uncharacterized protein n=1 Tax=Ranatra chinensis TaxID=642074 RepID=A0ABD0YSW3_9HEMI